MSLLPCVDSGGASQSYYIRNIGTGIPGSDPVIQGSASGGVLVGNPRAGIMLIGDTTSVVAPTNIIGGGQAAGGTLTISNSLNTDNIVLNDTTTAIITPLTTSSTISSLGDMNVGGNLNFTAGVSGKSISGYWSAQQAVAAVGAQANPAGLTQGVYLVAYAGAGAGNENAQPSGVFYWSGVSWVGNAVSFNFTAGAPNMAIGPVAGGATLNIGGAAVPLPGTLFFRKLMN